MAARILIVDDHPVVRAGLRVFLDQHDDLDVVAEAGSVAEARARATETAFDLVLLDLRLPDGNGGTLIPELASGADAPKVVVLTSTFDDEDVRRAVRAGAQGFLLKTPAPVRCSTACGRPCAARCRSIPRPSAPWRNRATTSWRR